ncbi:uncharacterized protein [Periplaneta americana]|uniref:uncharacterized protein isoform X1 n=1 Tax=Periplaneta americana TaxID=6978 RepID=UPI0037E8E920
MFIMARHIKTTHHLEDGTKRGAEIQKKSNEHQRQLALLDNNIPLHLQQCSILQGNGKENRIIADCVIQNRRILPKPVKSAKEASSAFTVFKENKKDINTEECKSKSSEIKSKNVLKDFLYVSEYSEDIIQHLQKIEEDTCVPLSVERQFSANHSVVVNWLIRVQHKLDLPGWVLFTAISLMDKALCNMYVKASELQALACTALWLATKSDSKALVPSISCFLEFAEWIFSAEQIFDFELSLLKISDFKINSVNPLTFVSYYLCVMDIENENVYYTCNYLLDIIYGFIKFSMRSPSLLAAAAVYSSLVIHKMKKEIWKSRERRTGFYTSDKVVTISYFMLSEMKRVQCNSGIFKKYSSSRYNRLTALM